MRCYELPPFAAGTPPGKWQGKRVALCTSVADFVVWNIRFLQDSAFRTVADGRGFGWGKSLEIAEGLDDLPRSHRVDRDPVVQYHSLQDALPSLRRST